MVTYSTAQGYKPDYLYLMQRMMMDNPEAAVRPSPQTLLMCLIAPALFPPDDMVRGQIMRTSKVNAS